MLIIPPRHKEQQGEKNLGQRLVPPPYDTVFLQSITGLCSMDLGGNNLVSFFIVLCTTQFSPSPCFHYTGSKGPKGIRFPNTCSTREDEELLGLSFFLCRKGTRSSISSRQGLFSLEGGGQTHVISDSTLPLYAVRKRRKRTVVFKPLGGVL